MEADQQSRVQEEFARVAGTFGARTAGRFDQMGVVGFSRVEPGESVAEVGAGTGNFLTLFSGTASKLIAVDITDPMLRHAPEGVLPVVGEGERLPLADSSIDLMTCAQMQHHIQEPLGVLKEMARTARKRVLVVDQVSPEDPAATATMNELEIARDPSHAESRPVSALVLAIRQAGLRLVDEKVVESRESFNRWMSAEEFPLKRVERVRKLVELRGRETGMEFEPDGDDFLYTRRRVMLLAEPA